MKLLDNFSGSQASHSSHRAVAYHIKIGNVQIRNVQVYIQALEMYVQALEILKLEMFRLEMFRLEMFRLGTTSWEILRLAEWNGLLPP